MLNEKATKMRKIEKEERENETESEKGARVGPVKENRDFCAVVIHR